jgi:hypothetical protein
MTLLERVRQLEAYKSTLEEKVAALQEGQGEAVLRLSAQLTAGESERVDLQKTAAELRAEKQTVFSQCILCRHQYMNLCVNGIVVILVQNLNQNITCSRSFFVDAGFQAASIIYATRLHCGTNP